MDKLLVVMVVLMLFPFVTYLTVKLGTYAFFRGRQLYFKDHQNEK